MNATPNPLLRINKQHRQDPIRNNCELCTTAFRLQHLERFSKHPDSPYRHLAPRSFFVPPQRVFPRWKRKKPDVEDSFKSCVEIIAGWTWEIKIFQTKNFISPENYIKSLFCHGYFNFQNFAATNNASSCMNFGRRVTWLKDTLLFTGINRDKALKEDFDTLVCQLSKVLNPPRKHVNSYK